MSILNFAIHSTFMFMQVNENLEIYLKAYKDILKSEIISQLYEQPQNFLLKKT